MSQERQPPEHQVTWRDALHQELRKNAHTIRELSIIIGARQKDLLDHLAHLERSLARTDEQLVVEPARCLMCQFEFTERTRLAKPGRCPRCKSNRITLPRFSIREA